MMTLSLQAHAVLGAELCLSWSDGVETFISLEKLRRSCPCAACQGEPDVTGRVIKPQLHYTDESFSLVRYAVVGGYALQPFWRDGHSTGIYSFSYLRTLG